MSIYLTIEEIRYYSTEIRESFERLINHRWFSARKDSKQWLFLKHCFAVLIGEQSDEFVCSEKQAINYKFEIADRLHRYYLASGNPVPFVFSLVHQKNEVNQLPDIDYPSCNGYLLRVSYNKENPDSLYLKKLLIEKAISEATDAEFQFYQKLPEIDLSVLNNYFDKNGSAYKKIAQVAKNVQKLSRTIQNENNPSTKRLIDVKIEKLTETTAQIRTSEYWLLMWWSNINSCYEYTYNELNRQNYFLQLKNGKWLVVDNIYPHAKTSTPRRYKSR